MSAYTHPIRGSDAPIGTLDFEDVIAHAVDILGTSFHKRVWECLHHPYLFSLDLPVLFVVVPKHSRPWYPPVRHLGCKLCKHRLGIPGRSLPIELIAGKDDQIGFLQVENVSQQGVCEIIRSHARIKHCITANTAGYRKV